MKTLSHGFEWLRLVFVLLLMGMASHAVAAKTYTDNHDGTVTDTTTGLVWMRCAMGQTWDGTTCTGTASTYTFGQANALTGNTTFAGHSDWSLPRDNDMWTIVDSSVGSPAIDLLAFPGTGPSSFWSASLMFRSFLFALVISFDDGHASAENINSFHQVRLLRAGQGQWIDPVVTYSTTTTTVANTTTTTTVTVATTPNRSPVRVLMLPIGWNLLGNGWNQPLSVASVFGDAVSVTTVWKWDVAKAGWQFYSPTITMPDLQNYAAGKGYGVLSTVGAGEGFWVNVKQPMTVTLPVTLPTGGSCQGG